MSRDDVSHRFLEAKETKLALFNFPIAFPVVPTNERMVRGRKGPGTWNESFREWTVQGMNGRRRERSAVFIRLGNESSGERTVQGTNERERERQRQRETDRQTDRESTFISSSSLYCVVDNNWPQIGLTCNGAIEIIVVLLLQLTEVSREDRRIGVRGDGQGMQQSAQ